MCRTWRWAASRRFTRWTARLAIERVVQRGGRSCPWAPLSLISEDCFTFTFPILQNNFHFPSSLGSAVGNKWILFWEVDSAVIEQFAGLRPSSFFARTSSSCDWVSSLPESTAGERSQMHFCITRGETCSWKSEMWTLCQQVGEFAKVQNFCYASKQIPHIFQARPKKRWNLMLRRIIYAL